jgi:hypothetical protein
MFFSMVNVGSSGVRAYNGLPLLQLTPSSTTVQNASQPFILNLTITNVTGLYGWDARIYFENAVVNCVDASEGPFLSSVNDTYWAPPNVTNGFNATHGMAFIGSALLRNVTEVNGSGLLATITFQPVGGGNATVHIDPEDTILVDRYLNRIPYTTADAVVSVPVFHNVAVMNVLPLKTAIGQGYTCNVSVTVTNLGTVSETFNVTLYGNSSSIMTQEVTLSSENSTTIAFVWNTSTFPKARYNMSAYAWPVPDEMNTSDNNFTDGVITVTIPGDINVDFKVSLSDLVLLANAYGTTPASGGTPPVPGAWNPNADINGDGKVSLSDLVILANHYGQHYP